MSIQALRSLKEIEKATSQVTDRLFDNNSRKNSKWKINAPSSLLQQHFCASDYNKITKGFNLRPHNKTLYERRRRSLSVENLKKNVFLTGHNPSLNLSQKTGLSVSTLVVNVKNLSKLTLTKDAIKTVVSDTILKKNCLKRNFTREISLKEELIKKNYLEEAAMENMVANLLDFGDLSVLDESLFDDLESIYVNDDAPNNGEIDVASSNESVVSNEFELFPQLQPIQDFTFDIPGLSDLPMEDFVDMEKFVKELEDPVVSESIPDVDVDNDTVVDDFSGQNSPEIDNETQMEYKELLDSLNSDEFFEALFNDANLNRSKKCETLDISDQNILTLNNSALSQDSIISSLLDLSTCMTEPCDETLTENKSVITGQKRGHTFDNYNEQGIKKSKNDDKNYSNVPSPTSSISSSYSDIDKVTLRRIKNNEASKVTRARRKEKHNKLFEKAAELEKSNAELRIKIDTMQKEADILRKALITKLSTVNKAD